MTDENGLAGKTMRAKQPLLTTSHETIAAGTLVVILESRSFFMPEIEVRVATEDRTREAYAMLSMLEET